MKGWTALKRAMTGEIPARMLWYRILQHLGSRRASLDYLYATNADPWSYETSDYEKTKYENTLLALPHPRYRRALEVACSIGVFTLMLAPRVDSVRGIDISKEAVRQARRRCASHENISFQVCDLLHFKTDTTYDLITCAEMLHYVWEKPSDRAKACGVLRKVLAPGGHLVAVSGEEYFPLAYESGFQEEGFRILTTQTCSAPGRDYRISVLSG